MRKNRTGLNKQGRIDWNSFVNLIPVTLGESGVLYASIIAEVTGMSTGQVYNRLRQCGISLKAVRRGETKVGQLLIEKYSVKTIKVGEVRRLKSTVSTPLKK